MTGADMQIAEIEVQGALQELYGCGRTGRGRSRLSEVTLLGSGYEADVFAFSLAAGAGEAEALVLRLYAGEGAGEKAEREYWALRRLRAAGYPVPAARLFRRERSPLGRPFVVMERIDGVNLAATYWPAKGEEHRALAVLLYRLIAGLQALDAGAILPESPLAGTCDPYAAIDQEIANLARLLDRLQGSEPPSLHGVLAWLAERRSHVPCERVVAIHGDFHPGNVLLGAGVAPTVIDWSNLRLGDYRAELAWTRLVTGAGVPPGRAEVELRVYEELMGKPVPEIEVFDVAACARLLLSVLNSLHFGAARQGLRAEAEARMRQDVGFTRRIAARLQALTGRRMPDLDDALSALLE